MKNLARKLALLAAVGLVGGQAYAQDKAITVHDAPVHSVPAEASGPVEDNATPDTLNSQYAALSKPAPQSRAPRSQAPQSDAPPAAAAEEPSAAVAQRIIDSAGAFEAYLRKSAAIDAKFANGPAVAKAVTTGSSYEIEQFQEGEVAYAALAALQDAAFVQGVYDFGRDPRDRADFAERILTQPQMVMQVDGADEAAGMVGGLLAHMGAGLVKAGQSVRQSAYDVQHQDWSKEDVPNADKRLADAKALGASKATLKAADTDALIKTLVALRKAGPAEPSRNPSPVVLRGLAVAALAVLGRAGEDDVDHIAPLLTDAKSADCMKMAKLNLYQCMAAAGPEYEDVFCLGAHAMIDTGQCVIQASGQTPLPTSLERTSAPKSSLSVSVPIALTSTLGPERQAAYGRPRLAGRAAPPAPAPESAPPPAPSGDVAQDEAAAPAPVYTPNPRQAAREAAREARAEQAADQAADDSADRGDDTVAEQDAAPGPDRVAPDEDRDADRDDAPAAAPAPQPPVRQAYRGDPRQQQAAPYAYPYASPYAPQGYYGYYGYGR